MPTPSVPAALLLALAVSAPAQARPRTEERLVTEAPSTLHPLFAANTADDAVMERLHPWLFSPTADGGWHSDVIASVTALGDVVSLAIDPEARWSDGHVVLGADVCATIARLSDRSHPTPYTSAVASRILSCRDDPAHPSAVAVTLTTPRADVRPVFAFPLLPAHRPDWTTFAGGPVPPTLVPVGLGPWTQKWKGSDWTLAPTGGADLPVAFRVEADPVGAFLAGRGTVVTVPPDRLPELRGLAEVTVERVRPGATWALFLDTSRPPFDDPSVRRAFASALDREVLAAAVLGRDPELAKQPWTLVDGPFPAGSPLASAGVVPVQPDPEALGDTELELTIAVPAGWSAFGAALTAATPGATATAQELTREQWALSLLDGGHAGASHAALVRLDEEPCAYLHTRTATDGFSNPFGFSDPAIDEACDALRLAAPDAGPTLHGRVADALPAIFLWTVEERRAKR